MQQLGELAAHAIRSAESQGQATDITQQEPPAMWLRRLWERMTALYGHAWTNVHGLSPQAKDQDGLTVSGGVWSGTLAGLTGQQIAQGVKACISTGGEFPPNAPRFRALCLSIPSLEVVRQELQPRGDGKRGGEPSLFARAVWAKLDAYRHQHASADQADKMLAGAYRLVHDAVMEGEPLPAAPVAAIAHEVRKVVPATPEQREAHFARIRELLGGGS